MPRDRGLRSLARDVARGVRGHDLALYAGGVTFYAVVGIVPMLLLTLYLAGLVAGETTVRSLADGLAALLPDELGAREAGRFLSRAGTGMSPVAAVAAVVPASLYGEGLVRAFDRLSRGDAGNRSLRGRLGSLVLLALSPLLLLAGLVASGTLVERLGDGVGDQVLGVYLSFVVGWLAVSPLLAYLYRGLAPERPGTRALLWGAFGTGSFLAGTALGFVLFLSLGIDLGGAYGGVAPLANAVAAFGWLFVLHLVVLVGYVTTLCLDARDGHPRGPAVQRDRVGAGAPRTGE
ncbi:MAG: putative glycosyl transferase [Frankiales bacterium]|nr:putative glycosyl transferase [Frankiales bacterium]